VNKKTKKLRIISEILTAARVKLSSGRTLETVEEKILKGEGDGVGAKGRAGVGEQDPVLPNLGRPVSEVV
jgi:hypothetical protein